MDKKAIDTIYYVMLRYNGQAEMTGLCRYKIIGCRGRVDVEVNVDFILGELNIEQYTQLNPISILDGYEAYYV